MSTLMNEIGDALNPVQNQQMINQADREALLLTQRRLQEEMTGGWACFFPYDGKCFSCGVDLVAVIAPSKLKAEMVTGCPKCHKSFVE